MPQSLGNRDIKTRPTWHNVSKTHKRLPHIQHGLSALRMHRDEFPFYWHLLYLHIVSYMYIHVKFYSNKFIGYGNDALSRYVDRQTV